MSTKKKTVAKAEKKAEPKPRVRRSDSNPVRQGNQFSS